jgi:hypothetical protein
MRFRFAAVLVVLALAVAGLWASTVASKPEQAAQAAAEKWLVLVDDGKFAESWESMAPGFKDEVSQRKWKSIIADIRKPLGKLVARKLKSAEFSKELPGAPEGEYVLLKFETSFENKPAASETVTPVLGQDLIWRVTGYSVK